MLTLNVLAIDQIRVQAYLDVQTELFKRLRDQAASYGSVYTLTQLEQLTDTSLAVYELLPTDLVEPDVFARLTAHMLTGFVKGDLVRLNPVMGRLGRYDHSSLFELFGLGQFRLTNLLHFFADETWVGISRSGRSEIYQLHVYPQWVDLAYDPSVYAVVKSKWVKSTGVAIDMQTHPVTFL